MFLIVRRCLRLQMSSFSSTATGAAQHDDAMNSLPGRVGTGRNRVNLLQVLKKDLKLYNLKLSRERELSWSIWRNVHPPVL